MEGKYYCHGTSLDRLINILLTGEIKCRRLIIEEKIDIKDGEDISFVTGYNGYEYISLCKFNNYSFTNNSAFSIFIRNSFCLIISDKIEAIKTIHYNNPDVSSCLQKEIQNFYKNNDESTYRFSDMCDEWQVRTRIPSKYFIGIAIPFSKIVCCNPRKIQMLIELAHMHNLEILDSEDMLFMVKFEKKKGTKNNVKQIFLPRA